MIHETIKIKSDVKIFIGTPSIFTNGEDGERQGTEHCAGNAPGSMVKG